MTICNDFTHRAGISRHHRQAGCHGLQEGRGNAVLVAEFGLNKRGNEDMGALEELLDLRFRLAALKMNETAEVVLLDASPQCAGVLLAGSGVVDSANQVYFDLVMAISEMVDSFH